jgi:hypothetical protein
MWAVKHIGAAGGATLMLLAPALWAFRCCSLIPDAIARWYEGSWR